MKKFLYTIEFTVEGVAEVFGVKSGDEKEFMGTADMHGTVIMEAENIEQAVEIISNHVKEEHGEGAVIGRIEFKNAKLIDSSVGDAMRDEIERMNNEL